MKKPTHNGVHSAVKLLTSNVRDVNGCFIVQKSIRECIRHWESHKARCLTPAGDTCKHCKGAIHPSEDGPLGICPCSSPLEWCDCEPRCVREWVCKCGVTVLCTVIFDEHRSACQDAREDYFADIRARFGEVVATREERLNRMPALSNAVVDDHERWRHYQQGRLGIGMNSASQNDDHQWSAGIG